MSKRIYIIVFYNLFPLKYITCSVFYVAHNALLLQVYKLCMLYDPHCFGTRAKLHTGSAHKAYMPMWLALLGTWGSHNEMPLSVQSVCPTKEGVLNHAWSNLSQIARSNIFRWMIQVFCCCYWVNVADLVGVLVATFSVQKIGILRNQSKNIPQVCD